LSETKTTTHKIYNEHTSESNHSLICLFIKTARDVWRVTTIKIKLINEKRPVHQACKLQLCTPFVDIATAYSVVTDLKIL